MPAGRPVVVKAGSSSLVLESGGLDQGGLERAVDHVAGLWDAGHPALLVSSGAVAAGLPALGLTGRPRDVPGLQAAAAVGQGLLMERYAALFGGRGRVVGQVLLTKDLLANRAQYLNARNALERMLTLGVVPIINENDTVVVDELRLGGNDELAAIVSHLVSAGLLVILTDTGGIYSGDPRVMDDVELLSAVDSGDAALDSISAGAPGPFGSGGVATKVLAARMAAWSGIPTVIADARESEVVARAVAGDAVGTWVSPHSSRLPARKLWIAFGLPAQGRLTVDDGASKALLEGGRSLLAVGIMSVVGDFEAESAVEVAGPDHEVIGKGLVAMGSDEVRESIGRHSSEVGVVVHRDDLVMLAVGRPPADRLAR
ncbi:MAG TPA: glutamate 5-kinase [Acidimicrobiia bacterium]|nr:glutamate 5-kinase [Acidimicrobiia bacterium]